MQVEDAHVGVESLRIDALGGRAYGIGVGLPNHRRPVLELRDGQLVGQHDVYQWVKRHEYGSLVVHVDRPRHILVGEVLR